MISGTREQVKKILKDRCSDFLNYENGEQQPSGEYFEGFYIEIEDILDILYVLHILYDAEKQVDEWLQNPDYMEMALAIQTEYKNKTLCQCTDEKYAGGYWDMASDLMFDELGLDADDEYIQEAIYNALKDKFVRPQGFDCDTMHD